MTLAWLYKHWRKVIAFCLTIISLAIVITIFSEHPISAFILKFFNNWSIALGAAATVVLAYVAFMSIMENRRIREEDRKLDFKARSLNEINDWAEEVVELVGKFQRGFRDVELFDRVSILQTKTIGIAGVASEISSDFSLTVNEAIKDFKAFTDEFDKERWTSLQEKSDRCKDSFINLLKSIAYLKAKLKL